MTELLVALIILAIAAPVGIGLYRALTWTADKFDQAAATKIDKIVDEVAPRPDLNAEGKSDE